MRAPFPRRLHPGLTALALTAGLLGPAAHAQTTVRLGYFPNLTHAPALIGLERGTFQKALGSAKLDARSFVSGTTLMEAFAAGQIDIAYVGPGPAISAATRGLPITFLAGASEAGAVLVARKDSGIKTERDLAGKIVAVPSLGNTQDISLRHLLKTAGLKPRADGGTVTIASIPPADIVTAFAGKRADAALVPEPWGAALEAQGHKVIGSEKTIWRDGKYPTTLLVASTRFVQQNPKLITAFLAAHNDAVTYLNRSPAAAQTLINRQLDKLTGAPLNLRVLQRALNRTAFTTTLNLAALNEYADLNVEAGYARSVPNLASFIYRAP